MVAINRQWWEHLAPKRMHLRRLEVERLLAQWCRSGYGAHWLTAASKLGGIMRVKPGQTLPVVRVIALGDEPAFIVPQEKVLAGHRVVNDTDEFVSGNPLEDGELVIEPSISLDLVDDEALLEAARRGDVRSRMENVKRPSLVFSAPARLLIAPKAWPKRAYVLYQHIFGGGGSYPNEGYFYLTNHLVIDSVAELQLDAIAWPITSAMNLASPCTAYPAGR